MVRTDSGQGVYITDTQGLQGGKPSLIRKFKLNMVFHQVLSKMICGSTAAELYSMAGWSCVSAAKGALTMTTVPPRSYIYEILSL